MDIKKQKTDILEKALAHVAFDGWSLEIFEKAAIDLNLPTTIIAALFPRGEADTITFFSEWADEKMIDALKKTNIEDLKVRARIRIAVEKRLEILTPHKEAVHYTFKKLVKPNYTRLSGKITWATADKIWIWAGDTSTDYNHYTKRGLLSGVIASTFLYWLQDDSKESEKTKSFLNNRIENVLFVGKNVNKLLTPLESVVKNFIVPTIKAKTEKV